MFVLGDRQRLVTFAPIFDEHNRHMYRPDIWRLCNVGTYIYIYIYIQADEFVTEMPVSYINVRS
jgi:hypothetical protein